MNKIIRQLALSVLLIFVIINNEDLLLPINLIVFFLFLLEEGDKRHLRLFFLTLFVPIVYSGIYGVYHYSLYDVFKDIYYLLNPILFLSVGAYIATKVDMRTLLKTIVIVGSVYSIVHVTQVVLQYGSGVFSDIRQIKDEIGPGHIIACLSLIFCIFSSTVFKLSLFKNKKLLTICLLLSGLSTFLSGSRTGIIIFIVFALTLSYPIYQNRKWLLIKNGIYITIISLLVYYFSKGYSLTDSFVNSLGELKMGNYTDPADMNNRFRGWESYQAFMTYSQGNSYQILMGHGAGKRIDLGTDFLLDDQYWRYIPVLHNGFMYILVKTGILGIILYMIYFINIIKLTLGQIASVDIQIKFQRLLLFGAICSLYISNFVISGLFNTGVGLLGIIGGAMIYYMSNPVEDMTAL